MNIKPAGSPIARNTSGKAASPSEASKCPFSGESFTSQPASGCPYLASKNRLQKVAQLTEQEPKAQASPITARKSAEMTAAGTAPGPSMLTLAKGLGLRFRHQGRGWDFWRVKWKDLSPARAMELASKFESFEVRSAKGDWSPVGSMEELRQLVHQAEKEAKIQAQLASAGAAAQMVTDSLARMPVALGTNPAPVAEKGPKQIGLLSFARGALRHHDSPLGFLEEFHAKHGRSFELKTPTHGKFLFDTRTDVILQALASTDGKDNNWKKSELQGHGASFLIGKKNMFMSGGEDWKSVRGALKGHLSSRKINSPEMINKLTGIFDDHLADLKERVANAPGGTLEIDARQEMQTAVLDVAFQVFMSTKVDKAELRKIQDAFNTQMSWLPEETVNPTDISLANLPGNGELRDAYKLLDGVAENLLNTRKASPGQHGDILDSFMALKDPKTGEPLSDQRIKHEILSLLEAGHETTATMMGWSVLMMAHNPKEYQALRAEVDRVVGDDIPDKAEVRALDTSERILKETLRMYPPFYLFMRQATEDTTIGEPGQEVNVKAGTTLVSSLYETHRDEELWGEEATGFPANEFHSDRFTERPPEAFLAFGAGKRSCAGRVLGMLEGNLMLTRLAQDFDISPVSHDTIEMGSDLSIHPKNGKVKLSLRSDG